MKPLQSFFSFIPLRLASTFYVKFAKVGIIAFLRGIAVFRLSLCIFEVRAFSFFPEEGTMRKWFSLIRGGTSRKTALDFS